MEVVGPSKPRLLLFAFGDFAFNIFWQSVMLFLLFYYTDALDIPIGVAAAAGMGISPRPVLISTAVAAAGAFLTPIATPTNLMVMGPGGYAFGDYWKLGLPLLLWFFVVAVFYVPIVWPF